MFSKTKRICREIDRLKERVQEIEKKSCITIWKKGEEVRPYGVWYESRVEVELVKVCAMLLDHLGLELDTLDSPFIIKHKK